MTITIERGSLADLAIFIPLRATLDALAALYSLLAAVCGYWRPIALSAALVGVVTLCTACPLLPMGLGLIALFGWATYPQGVQHA